MLRNDQTLLLAKDSISNVEERIEIRGNLFWHGESIRELVTWPTARHEVRNVLEPGRRETLGNGATGNDVIDGQLKPVFISL